MASPRRSHDEYVAAALQALAEHGPAFSTPLSMADVAKALGVSRASLYQWWRAGSDLDADVTAHLAAVHENWMTSLLAQPPAGGLRSGLARVLAGSASTSGVVERAAAAAWPASSASRTSIASSELRTTAELGAWLRAADGGRNDAPWADVALGVAAYVEGRLFLDRILRPDPDAPIAEEDIQAVSAIASNLVTEFLSATSGAGAPLEIDAVEDAGPSPTGRTRALEEIASWPRADRRGAGTPRLVDTNLLASAIGVSTRRLQTVWPTPSDLNSDLVAASIGALRARVEDLTFQTFTAAMGGYDKFLGLFESTYQAILVSGGVDARPWFGCAPALGDERIRSQARDLLTEWQAAQHLALFASLQVIGHRVRSNADGSHYVSSVFACVNGALRLSLLHPSVLDRTVVYEGRTCGALPAAIDAMFRSFTEPAEPTGDPTDDPRWAPPLPEQP